MTVSYTLSWQTVAGPSRANSASLGAANPTYQTDIVRLSDRGYFEIWDQRGSLGNIEGRAFYSSGAPTGPEFTINAQGGTHVQGSLSTLSDGRVISAFVDTGGGAAGNIRVRLSSSFNTANDPGKLVASTTSSDNYPAVTGLSDGGYALAWTDTTSHRLEVQSFDVDGAARGSVLSPAYTASSSKPLIAGLTSGDFVVATVTNEGYVEASLYYASGNLRKALINISLYSAAQDADLIALQDGGFAVAYTAKPNGANDSDIYLVVYNADGTYRNGPQNITGTGAQHGATLTQLDSGYLVVGWSDAGGSYEKAVVLNGAAAGPEFKVASDGVLSSNVGIGAGLVATVWASTSSDQIGRQTIRTSLTELVSTATGNGAADMIVGSSLKDILAGGAGNDTVDGGTNINTLDGGAGDDTAVFAFKLTDATISLDLAAHTVVSGPSTVDTLTSFEHYQFVDGVVNEATGSPLVDDLFYSIRYKDVFAAHLDPGAHYDSFGWHDGRDPNAFFSTNGYLGSNQDVKAAGLNPLQHYDLYGWKDGRDPSASFDTTLYLQHNADVKAAGIDPLVHFLQFGQAEGRQAYAAIGPTSSFSHGSFDAEFYLLANPDVAKAVPTGVSANAFAYDHYEAYGWHEGRNPNALFDVKGYLNAYADVKAANIDPLGHYDTFGWKDGRDPSGAFDTKSYVSHNADVAAAHIDPLLHYLQYGAYENRSTYADGTFFHA